MQIFDYKTAPLDQSLSLEASAGTGKTYTLERLFVRLILERKLPLEKVLVVTFTNKAARELEERIRTLLWKEWNEAKGPDEVLLRRACLDFDGASIYTIHSFCKHILTSFSFEMGNPFMLEMEQDESRQREEFRDWFRRKQNTGDALVKEGFRMALAGSDFESYLDRLQNLSKGWDSLSNGIIFPGEEEDELFRSWLSTPENDVSRLCLQWDQQLDRSRLYDQFVDEKLITRRTKPETVKEFLTLWDRAAQKNFNPALLIELSRNLFFYARKQIKKPGEGGFALAREALRQALEPLDDRWSEDWAKTLELRLSLNILKEISQDKRDRRSSQKVYRFDDLIDSVHQSLCGPSARPALLEILQNRYRVLLIDEFQDTDQRQWDIFKRIFSHSGQHNYFLIGDPKQSIYRFRGADLNVYYRAVEEVAPSCRFQLNTNYRSTPSLMVLFNRIFQRLFHENKGSSVDYHQVAAGAARLPLQAEGKPLPVLSLVDIALEENPKVARVTQSWMEAIADQTALLLRPAYCQMVKKNDNTSSLDRRDLQAGDIAVLMEKNKDCLKMQALLQSRGIPAVISGESDIFNSPAFEIMLHFLRFTADPSSLSSLRFLLLTPLFRLSAEELHHLEEWGGLEMLSLKARVWKRNETDLEDLFDIFSDQGREIAQLLSDKQAISDEKALWLQNPGLDRLLSLNQGERIFTDTLHLLELFQRERIQKSLDFQALAYLAGSESFKNRLEDEKKLRLEREGEVVQIITLHSSKGLQFPVVFFAGAMQSRINLMGDFISYTREGRICYSALKKDYEKKQAMEEAWQERLKLYYVALTRAESRLYLPCFSQGSGTMLDSLYHYFLPGAAISPAELSQLPSGGQKKALQAQLLLSSKELIKDLTATDDGSVELISWIPDALPVTLEIKETPDPQLAELESAPFYSRIFGMTSFSSLTRHAHNQASALQIPEESERLTLEDRLPETEGNLQSPESAPRDLPGGADLGNLVHQCFEEMDFSWPLGGENEQAALDGLMKEISLRYFPSQWYAQWQDSLRSMITEALMRPMEELGGAALCQLSPGQRCHELEFLLKTKSGDMGLGSDKWSVENGFLKGFLDLVFIWQGRYYILDWKTTANPEHPAAGGYHSRVLDQLMEHHHYDLQAMIYWSALSRYLKLILKEQYSYQSMGGVFYLFLRGMDTPGEGVWFHRPEEQDLQIFEQTFLEELP